MDEQIVRAVGADVYNGVITGDIACTLNANTGGGGGPRRPYGHRHHGMGREAERTGRASDRRIAHDQVERGGNAAERMLQDRSVYGGARGESKEHRLP